MLVKDVGDVDVVAVFEGFPMVDEAEFGRPAIFAAMGAMTVGKVGLVLTLAAEELHVGAQATRSELEGEFAAGGADEWVLVVGFGSAPRLAAQNDGREIEKGFC